MQSKSDLWNLLVLLQILLSLQNSEFFDVASLISHNMFFFAQVIHSETSTRDLETTPHHPHPTHRSLFRVFFSSRMTWLISRQNCINLLRCNVRIHTRNTRSHTHTHTHTKKITPDKLLDNYSVTFDRALPSNMLALRECASF